MTANVRFDLQQVSTLWSLRRQGQVGLLRGLMQRVWGAVNVRVRIADRAGKLPFCLVNGVSKIEADRL